MMAFRYKISEDAKKQLRLTGVEALKAQLYGPNESRRGLGGKAVEEEEQVGGGKETSSASLDNPDEWDSVLSQKKE